MIYPLFSWLSIILCDGKFLIGVELVGGDCCRVCQDLSSHLFFSLFTEDCHVEYYLAILSESNSSSCEGFKKMNFCHSYKQTAAVCHIF